MSKVQPRGEVSLITAAVFVFLVLAVSGLSVWRFVFQDVSASVAPGQGVHNEQSCGVICPVDHISRHARSDGAE